MPHYLPHLPHSLPHLPYHLTPLPHHLPPNLPHHPHRLPPCPHHLPHHPIIFPIFPITCLLFLITSLSSSHHLPYSSPQLLTDSRVPASCVRRQPLQQILSPSPSSSSPRSSVWRPKRWRTSPHSRPPEPNRPTSGLYLLISNSKYKLSDTIHYNTSRINSIQYNNQRSF